MGAIEDDIDYFVRMHRERNMQSHHLEDQTASWDNLMCVKCQRRGGVALSFDACPGSEQDKRNQEMREQARNGYAGNCKPGERQAQVLQLPVAGEVQYVGQDVVLQNIKFKDLTQSKGYETDIDSALGKDKTVVQHVPSMLVPAIPGNYLRIVQIDGVMHYEDATQEVENLQRVRDELDSVLVSEWVPIDYDTPGAVRESLHKTLAQAQAEILDTTISAHAYIAYLHKDKGFDYGVSFPDFPGAITAGGTLEEAKDLAREALTLHLKGMAEDGETIPEPSKLDDLANDPAMKGAVAFLVSVEPPSKVQRYESTLTRLQQTVFAWVIRCFGGLEACSPRHRAHRMLEEAVELFQALGGSPEKAHALVDHIYTKPAGDPAQEIGGVMVTLMSVASALNMDLLQLAVREVRRILSKPVEHFQKRNAVKNELGFNGVED